MSTRGAYGFKLDGKLYITYNHCDSYPSGLGELVVDFVKKTIKDNRLEELKTNVRQLRLVDDNVTVTKQDIEKYERWFEEGYSKNTKLEWYSLLRGLQYGEYLPAVLNEGLDVIINSDNFLYDSLFCEYAYIIDLDEGVLHFCKGFNKEVPANNPLNLDYTKLDGDYRAVVVMGSPKLSKIPKTWQTKYYKEKD